MKAYRIGLMIGAMAIAVTAASAVELGKRYGVVAGCILPQSDPLTYTLSDAKLVYDRLSASHASIEMLSSDSADPATKPTKSNVLAAIKRQVAKCGPNDTFWFYWSGHGDQFKGQSYILAYDVDPTNFKTFISVAEIRKIVSTCKARAKTIILDACHSGSEKAFTPQTWEQTMVGFGGLVTMAASQVNETALECRELGHGLFTFFLIRGLAGDATTTNGYVTLKSLDNYVCEAVSNYAQQNNRHSQHPKFIYEQKEGTQPLSEPDPQALSQMSVPSNATVVERPKLKPGIAIAIRTIASDNLKSANTRFRAKLIKDKFLVVSDEMTKPFEEVLASSAETAAEMLPEWRSSFLIRGTATIDSKPLTGVMSGLYSAQVSLDVELIDATGKVIAAISSSEDGKPVRASDTLEAGAVEKALVKAIEQVYPKLRKQIMDSLKP